MSNLTKDVNQSINFAKNLVRDEDFYDIRCQNNPDVIQRKIADSPPQQTSVKSDGYSYLAVQSTRRRLLDIDEMPRYLQFNPYIISGYRNMLTTKGSVASLFYFHNETINILTHGIPIIYILWTVPPLIPWDRINTRFLPFCHIVGSVCPWIGSFLYHLFMNHAQGGERLYHRLLQLDMLGIWVTQSFGALPMVCSTAFCFPWSLRWLVISFYCLLSVWGLYKALLAWSPWERRLCFALPFIMRLCLTLARVTGLGGGDPSALPSVFLQDFVSLIGGIIGAIHVPEKWFPGQFDLCFNSHNIMHVLVVLAVYYMHHATIADLIWMASVECGQIPDDHYMEVR